MGAKGKSGKVRATARKHAAKALRTWERRLVTAAEPWEQTAQIPDDRADEIDCQRIVRGDGGRGLPLYYDDYN